MSEARNSDWFSLARQPQDPPSPEGPTLKGDDLERWKAQFRPLLRFLNRKRVVVALSGGGMAMPCHVSVLRTLELLDIPVSGIYGTSAGAVIGGLRAAGVGVADLERIMLDINSSDDLFGFASRYPAVRLAAGEVVRAFAGPSVERSGLYGSGRLEEYVRTLMRTYLGGIPSMRDLKMPFAAVAFDIGTGHPDRGSRERAAKRVFSPATSPEVSLADAMSASMAIPGTLPPKKIGDRYYIDGASVEHLPVVTAFDDWQSSRWFGRPREVVIAVDLSYGGSAPQEKSLCHPMDLVLYSNSIQCRAITDYSLLHCHRPRRGFSVILLRPRTFSIGLCDVEKIPAAMRTAYAQTVDQLSGADFLGLTEKHIQGAGSFLGLSRLRSREQATDVV
jgi:predicted acylesterase/phospholipase RssA